MRTGIVIDEVALEHVVDQRRELAAAAAEVPSSERIEKAAPPRNARRGSSQSAADFRFSNPYAFSAQMLPVALPNVGTFSF